MGKVVIRLLVSRGFLTLIREDLCDIIQQQPDMEVVGSAASGEAIQALAMAVDFDVILMDVEMETTTAGIRATERILEQKPAAKIIFLTAHETDNMILTSMGAGAVDYIVKGCEESQLLEHIRAAYMARPYWTPASNSWCSRNIPGFAARSAPAVFHPHRVPPDPGGTGIGTIAIGE